MGPNFHITSDQLASLIGTPRAPHIFDVCLPEDHALNPRVIPGAMRCGFQDAAELTIDAPVVIACQKGLKLSQGVAALLRQRGMQAQFLQGGMVHWAQANLPLIATTAHPGIGTQKNRWVLPDRLDPKALLDAWSVARFVDKSPIWMHVEDAQVDLVSDRFVASVPAHLATVLRDAIPMLGDLTKTIQIASLNRLLKAACVGSLDPSVNLSQGFAILDASWTAAQQEAAQ